MLVRRSCPDHPRACGANRAVHVVVVGCGSSPRVRGKRRRREEQERQRRIIPARAGQTPRARAPRCPGPDHPRACGANPTGSRSPVSRSGSSPRVRGKLYAVEYVVDRGRIIPARAGQTLVVAIIFLSLADHPRACGANLVLSMSLLTTDGSSPRVRGKPHDAARPLHAARIIPARAGQTMRAWRLWCCRSDHPRACGANLAISCRNMMPCGSSPRVRGKRVQEDRTRPPNRIIPARAGQTARPRPRPTRSTDHPRACGANTSTP